MRIGMLGVNHKSASLELREVLALAFEKLFAELANMVLLSTCNRTEIYFSAKNPDLAHAEYIQDLRFALDVEFEHALYSFFGKECFIHLSKVTAGLDSACFGGNRNSGSGQKSLLKSL